MIDHNPLPVSYSRLNLFERCAAQYRYRYIDKLSTPKAPQAQRGTDIHASIEGFLKGEKTTLVRAAMPIIQALHVIKGKAPNVELKLCFSENFEYVIPWDDKNGWFRMVLDGVYFERNIAYVQEWKSGKQYDDHADQRALYGLGAMATDDKINHAVVTTYYLDLGKTTPLHVDLKGATITAQRLTQRIGKMVGEEYYAPRPGMYCRWCPYSKKKGGPCKVA